MWQTYGHINQVITPQRYDAPASRKLLSGSRSPIRILIDSSKLTSDTDRTCYSAGQSYKVGTPSGASTPACSTDVTTDCWGTCSDADVLTTQKRQYLVQTVIPSAVSWLQAALSVTPVSGNLILQAQSECGFYGGVSVNAPYTTTGVSNTDIVLFLTARPTAGSVIAFAGQCQQDASGRNRGSSELGSGASQLANRRSESAGFRCNSRDLPRFRLLAQNLRSLLIQRVPNPSVTSDADLNRIFILLSLSSLLTFLLFYFVRVDWCKRRAAQCAVYDYADGCVCGARSSMRLAAGRRDRGRRQLNWVTLGETYFPGRHDDRTVSVVRNQMF